MTKINPLFLLLISVMTCLLMACSGKDPQPKSRTELITKNWKVREVSVNGAPVFTDPFNQSVDTEDFSAYRLHFSNPTNFSRTEVGGVVTTTGTWEFVANTNESRIKFNDGTPSEVTIDNLEENLLTIRYTVQSQKTGPREYVIQMVPVQ